MNTGHESRHGQRQIRFAEAGILFVLILAVAVFVGVKFAGNGADESPIEPEGQLPTLVAAPQDSSSSGDAAGQFGLPATADPSENLTASDRPRQSPAADGSQPAASERVVSYAMAEAAYFEARYAEAVDLFTAYMRRNPENAWGHYMLGLSFWKDGSPDAAEESLQEALAIQPDHVKSLINLARVLLAQNRPAEALPQIEKAVALSPENADAYRVLGRVYDGLQRRQEAITAYKQALRQNCDDAWSLNNLGLLYIESGQYQSALGPLARAVQLQSDRAPFQNNLGIALERNGYQAQAAQAFERALEADADYGKAEVSLARVQQLPENADQEPLDLAATAERFSLESTTPVPTPATVVAVDANEATADAEALTDRQP